MATFLSNIRKGGQNLLSVVVSAAFVMSLTPVCAFAQTDESTQSQSAATYSQVSNPPEALTESTETSQAERAASDWWNTQADESWYSDSQTSFTLTTPQQLAGLATLVNSGTTFSGKTVRLGANIDLSGYYWVPIGGNRGISGNTPTGNAFDGTFDGGYTASNGTIARYAITGLNITWNMGDVVYTGQAVSSSTSYAAFGLFGYVSGTLQNVDVAGSITSDARLYETGGVVGTTTGSVYNCSSSVNINLTSVYSARTGGVVGEAMNDVENVSNYIQYCNNTGTLNVVRYGGGIVGSVDCSYDGGVNINYCYNTGNISNTVIGDSVQIGGIAGQTTGYINNCYSVCSITLSYSSSNVGGLVGWLNSSDATVNRCYADVDYTGSASMANLMPAFGYVANNATKMSNVLWVVNNDNTQTIATGANSWGYWTLCGPCTYDVLTGTSSQNPTVYSSTGTGSSSSNTNSVMTLLGSEFTRTTGSRPILAWQETGLVYGDFGIGSGTESDPFRIQSQSDLEAINEALNGNNGFAGKYFKIMNDITLDSTWQGLGNLDCKTALTNSPYPGANAVGFAGILDGNGCTISITRTVTNQNGQGGLINYLAPTGQISNLTVSGTMVITYTNAPDCATDVEGISAFGGVVGYNCGIIDNVSSRVTITNNTGSGNATYETETQIYNVGGIVGFNDAFYQAGAQGTIRNSRNYNAVTGYEKVGGIVGENAGLIASCYNGGQITPTSTRRSGAGGIAGRNGNNNTAVEVGIIRGCANYGNIYSGITDGTDQEQKDSQSSWIGGIAGWLSDTCWIYNSYNYGNVRGYGYAGYIAGGTGWIITTTGETNYTGGIKYCFTRTDSTGATPESSEQRGVNGVQLAGGGLSYLNDENETYGTFSTNNTYSTPMPNYNATATAGSAEGWSKIEKTVYLDTSATTNGDGTSASTPYNSLDSALTGVEVGKIYVMSTINITSRTTIWDNIEFIRYTGNNFTGPMFNINAPDSVLPGGTTEKTTYVSFDNGEVNASGIGVAFNVQQGRLRLRDGVKITNAEQGVVVQAAADAKGNAEVQLEETYINTKQAVWVAGNESTSVSNQKNGIFYSASGKYAVKLLGNVYLGANTVIQTTSKITCPFTYECADPAVDRIVLQGIDNRILLSTDLPYVKYVGDAVTLQLVGAGANNSATMKAVNIVYVNGTLAENGTGTEANPYNNIASAMANTDAKLILINGTTALTSGTYSGKTIQNNVATSTTSAFTMFTDGMLGETTTLNGVTILAAAPGKVSANTTVINLNGGNIVLDGGTVISGAKTAVDMLAGSCTVKDTQVSASEYSFKVEDYLAKLYFNMTVNTKIDGTIYLDTSSVEPLFYISSALMSNLVVECGDAYVTYVIAEGSGGYTITESDASKVSYVNGDFKVEVEDNTLVLADV